MAFPPDGKKDKGAAAPEAKACANCLAPDGENGVIVKACTRCKLTHYCGRACQTAHWKAFHKQFCLTLEERAPQLASSPPPTSQDAKPSDWRNDKGPVECAICLDPLVSGAVLTLPCSHTFHAACVAGLRSFGLKQVCPMCRVELPPGPDKLFEEATRRYFEVKRRVDRGDASWGALTKALQREMNEVIGLLRNAAEQGHAGSQCNLGFMYENGQGVKQDPGEAVRLNRKAADQGHANAQFNLGVMYENGQGVKQDYVEAVRLFRKAAEQGYANAQSNLGTMYAQGQGVKQDYGEAVRLYRKAADQGQANAQSNLGVMYSHGQGVKQDYVEAVRWYRKAAEQGYADAQFNLGCRYFTGQGVDQDYGEALRWYHKAAAQGHDGAKKWRERAEEIIREQHQATPSSPLYSSNTCANCGVAEAAGSVALKPCSRCKAVVYCGRDCQKQHWKAGGHRAGCKYPK